MTHEQVCVAVLQTSCGWECAQNFRETESWIRKAASEGAQIILPHELFATPYFCQDQNARFFDLATPLESCPVIQYFIPIARELGVVLPISFFERAQNVFYNSVAVIDADGKVLGVYRKTHIPDGPGYQEKFYFTPGDTGFKVWPTRFGTIGVGICWDQWFPEAARIMTLMGAEFLFYPTSIGLEPHDPTIDSQAHWQRVIQGHAAANMIPIITSNRVGIEKGETTSMNFYGSSFIANEEGAIVTQLSSTHAGMARATFDRAFLREKRRAWGLFRDRRPEQYRRLLASDGIDPSL